MSLTHGLTMGEKSHNVVKHSQPVPQRDQILISEQHQAALQMLPATLPQATCFLISLWPDLVSDKVKTSFFALPCKGEHLSPVRGKAYAHSYLVRFPTSTCPSSHLVCDRSKDEEIGGLRNLVRPRAPRRPGLLDGH